MALNIIDIEASGFGADSYPIEVGIVMETGERYCSLIAPPSSWQHWSDDAQVLHGISRELLVDKGLEILDLCKQLNEFIGRDTVYSDALSHDQRWLNKLYYHAKIIPSFNMRAIEYLVSEEQLSYWDQVKEEVISEFDFARHRASNDALVIQQTLKRIQCRQ